jgi:hypothetical protein
MYPRSAWRSVVRFAIVTSVVLVGTTFSTDDAEARRGGKVRSSSTQSKPHDSAKQHDGAETTRKSGHDEDDSAASSGGSYVPGPRVRSREASHGSTKTTSDAGAASRRSLSLVAAAASGSAANKDIEVPGCATGMICTVCLAGCDGTVNSIVDAEPMTPRPQPRE